jgi:peroxiredoxin
MLRTILLYILGIIAAIGLGLVLGSLYTDHRWAAATATKLEGHQQYLQRNIHDMGVGKPFPDIPLWKPDGVTTVQIRDLLPRGGLVIYTSGDCPSCIETVRALGEARRSLKDKVSPAVIISGGDPTRIVDFVAKESINVAVVRDTQMSLSSDYGVVSVPSYFLLDEKQVVHSFGVTGGTTGEFTKLLTQ